MVGVPDPKYGEELCAWIVLQAGRECDRPRRSRAFCRGQIAHYKVPRHIRFVDAFPMTVTGKMQKFLIREQMIEELGLEVDEDRLTTPGPPRGALMPVRDSHGPGRSSTRVPRTSRPAPPRCGCWSAT